MTAMVKQTAAWPVLRAMGSVMGLLAATLWMPTGNLRPVTGVPLLAPKPPECQALGPTHIMLGQVVVDVEVQGHPTTICQGITKTENMAVPVLTRTTRPPAPSEHPPLPLPLQ